MNPDRNKISRLRSFPGKFKLSDDRYGYLSSTWENH